MRAEWLEEKEYERIKSRIEKITAENEKDNDWTYICSLTDLEKKIDKLSACYEIDIEYGKEEDKEFILEETLKEFDNFKFDNNLMTEEMEKQFAIEYFKNGFNNEYVVRDIYNTDNGIEITINGKEVKLTPDDLAKNHCSEELYYAYRTMHHCGVGDDMLTEALSEEVAKIENEKYPYDTHSEEEQEQASAQARIYSDEECFPGR